MSNQAVQAFIQAKGRGSCQLCPGNAVISPWTDEDQEQHNAIFHGDGDTELIRCRTCSQKKLARSFPHRDPVSVFLRAKPLKRPRCIQCIRRLSDRRPTGRLKKYSEGHLKMTSVDAGLLK